MNKALADLLESTLDAWYGTVSGWTPPGMWTAQQCDECPESPFIEAAGLADWPHELAHDLVQRLEGVVTLVRVSIEELDVLAVGRVGVRETIAHRDAIAGRAEAAVVQQVTGHAAAIDDVLVQCVGARLDAYLAREVERAIAAFA